MQRLLAQAELSPMMTDGRVLFVDGLWEALAAGAKPGGALLHQSWRAQADASPEASDREDQTSG